MAVRRLSAGNMQMDSTELVWDILVIPRTSVRFCRALWVLLGWMG